MTNIKKLSHYKKITIKDIADKLGISPSAVSRALHDNPRISDKTKKKVQQIAKKLNYQPNNLASALRKGKSNLVGLIVPRVDSNFFSSVVENLEKVLNKKGYNIIIAQSNESYTNECKVIDVLINTQVDGIIASLANETVDFSAYEKIKSKKIPLILFDRGENDIGVDYVGIDDYQSSHLIVDHLVAQKCTRIAHIAGYRHTRIFKNRIRGFIDALQKHKLPFDDKLILECDLTLEDGRAKMQQILQYNELPDAVYAASDYAALGALQVLQEHHIKVPQEIALAGFGDEAFTSLVTPSITTIKQHSDKIGKIAADTFLERIENPNRVQKLNKIILDGELLIRNSTKRHF